MNRLIEQSNDLLLLGSQFSTDPDVSCGRGRFGIGGNLHRSRENGQRRTARPSGVPDQLDVVIPELLECAEDRPCFEVVSGHQDDRWMRCFDFLHLGNDVRRSEFVDLMIDHVDPHLGQQSVAVAESVALKGSSNWMIAAVFG